MIIGLIGMFLTLLIYFLKTNNKIDDLAWHTINIVGTSCLLVYSVIVNTLPFMILNILFLLISLKGIHDYFNQPKILLDGKKQVN